ncbi:MAG: UvrD-helicase domain-containing protein [Armatimonadetes bacterium]|nr:UvrD-helicase domain-containing protein [Armatimonadota bacterium]
MRHTAEQRRVIEKTDGSLTVVAAAGAGKTGVLTDRYVHLVANHGLSPEQILAITFTRKATAELKSRIMDKLEKQGLHQARREAERSYIHTIQGLCRRILAENPFEAGLDPQFTVLEKGVVERLKHRAIERAFENILRQEKHEHREGTLLLARSYLNRDHRRNRSDPFHSLRSLVETLYENCLQDGLSANDLWRWASIRPGSAQERIAEIVNARLIDAGWEPDALPEIDDPDWTARAISALRQMQSDPSEAKRQAAIDAQSLLLQINPAEEAKAVKMIDALLSLTADYSKVFETLKQEAGGIDLHDLQARTRDLLRNSATVAHRYRSTFACAMVDEFQDTDPVQVEIVRLLVDDDKLMIVGDSQQSIFRFRGADASVFQAEIERASEAQLCQLPDNFRSHPEVLDFVDHIFGHAWSNAYQLSKPARPRDSAPQPETRVQVWHSHQDPYAEPNAIARAIRHWVDDQTFHIDDRPVRFGDFAILMPRFTHVARLENALASESIPYFVVGGGRGYWLRYEVRDLANLLKSMASDDDEIAWMSLLRSPMVGLSLDAIARIGETREKSSILSILREKPEWLWETDKEKIEEFLTWWDRVAALRDRRPVGWLLGQALEKSRYEAKIITAPDGPQQVANVRKLWAIALAEPATTIAEFARKLDLLVRLNQREGNAPTYDEDADVVKIFTIHGAKGLEFPIVFLAGTAYRGRPESDSLLTEPRKRMIGLAWSGYESLNHRIIDDSNRRAEEAEAKRLLYVALTRAQERLIVCLTQGENPIARTLNGALSQYINRPTAEFNLGKTRVMWKNME